MSEEPASYDREAIVSAIRRDPQGNLLTMLSLVENEPDQEWLEGYLVGIVEQADLPTDLRRMAVWSLGDVARTRGRLFDHSVVPLLWRTLRQPELTEAADMALGDIELHHGWRGRCAGRRFHVVASGVRRLLVRSS
jgi:hypothetical protein